MIQSRHEGAQIPFATLGASGLVLDLLPIVGIQPATGLNLLAVFVVLGSCTWHLASCRHVLDGRQRALPPLGGLLSSLVAAGAGVYFVAALKNRLFWIDFGSKSTGLIPLRWEDNAAWIDVSAAILSDSEQAMWYGGVTYILLTMSSLIAAFFAVLSGGSWSSAGIALDGVLILYMGLVLTIGRIVFHNAWVHRSRLTSGRVALLTVSLLFLFAYIYESLIIGHLAVATVAFLVVSIFEIQLLRPLGRRSQLALAATVAMLGAAWLPLRVITPFLVLIGVWISGILRERRAWEKLLFYSAVLATPIGFYNTALGLERYENAGIGFFLDAAGGRAAAHLVIWLLIFLNFGWLVFFSEKCVRATLVLFLPFLLVASADNVLTGSYSYGSGKMLVVTLVSLLGVLTLHNAVVVEERDGGGLLPVRELLAPFASLLERRLEKYLLLLSALLICLVLLPNSFPRPSLSSDSASRPSGHWSFVARDYMVGPGGSFPVGCVVESRREGGRLSRNNFEGYECSRFVSAFAGEETSEALIQLRWLSIGISDVKVLGQHSSEFGSLWNRQVLVLDDVGVVSGSTSIGDIVRTLVGVDSETPAF